MVCVLAVDAGNSKTVALTAGLDGSILGAGRAGCGDIYGVFGPLSRAEAEAQALASVRNAVCSALQGARQTPADVVSSAFSMAGADWPEDFQLLRAAALELGLGANALVVNDAIGALWVGSPARTGVAVVCGTGAAIGAQGKAGSVWHSSHWPEPLGAHALGRLTLRAVYRAELGIDGPTTLTSRVLELMEQPSVEDVLHQLTARAALLRPDLGRLAAALLDEAEAGDATSVRIAQEHGALIGDYALVAARRVGLIGDAFPLVLAGGLFRHPSRLLAAAIVATVTAHAPLALPMQSRLEPVIGAVMMALEGAGRAVDDDVLSRITATMPASALFSTLTV